MLYYLTFKDKPFKKNTWCIFFLLVLSLLKVLLPTPASAKQDRRHKLSVNEALRATHKLEIPFIVNKGQINNHIKFYANTVKGTVFVMDNGEIVYSFSDYGSDKKKTLRTSTFKEEIINARINEIKGKKKTVTSVNYFTGKEPSKWRNNISAYEYVTFKEVYDGIAFRLRAYGNKVEKLFYVKPKANPEEIQLKLTGIKALKINKAGQLEAETLHRTRANPLGLLRGGIPYLPCSKAECLALRKTRAGKIILSKPFAYQEIDGNRVMIDVEYEIQNSEYDSEIPQFTYGFKLAPYDKTKELVIDPIVSSTYLGGTGGDYGRDIVTDAKGNIYVCGNTSSVDFPTTENACSANKSGSYDIFVSKINEDLTQLLASTFLGGSKDDYARSLTIDSGGNIYVTGETESSDFPVTENIYDNSYNDTYNGDVFVLKLNKDLTNLEASTYLGGERWDMGNSITMDSDENIIVAGYTMSPDFPTTEATYSNLHNKGYEGFYGDAFISKLNGNLTKLIASTYFGGSDTDSASSVIIDKDGNIFITGRTKSADFPTTPGVYDTDYNNDQKIFHDDIFISKINADLDSLIASAYLGGSKDDIASSIAIDAERNIYVAGHTKSSDFPTSSNAYSPSFNGGLKDAVISKLNTSLTKLLSSTYLGGTKDDVATSMEINTDGIIYVSGNTSSPDFPVSANANDTSFNDTQNNDIFLSKLNDKLTNLSDATYLGGSGEDTAKSIAIGSNDYIYVIGHTTSADFPITSDAYSKSNNGDDAFITKINLTLLRPEVTTGSLTNVIPPDFATMNGMVNPNGQPTTVWFEYGKKSGKYNKITKTQTVSGLDYTVISIDTDGLPLEDNFYYRIVAENSTGVTYGKEMVSNELKKRPETTATRAQKKPSAANANTANLPIRYRPKQFRLSDENSFESAGFMEKLLKRHGIFVSSSLYGFNNNPIQSSDFAKHTIKPNEPANPELEDESVHINFSETGELSEKFVSPDIKEERLVFTYKEEGGQQQTVPLNAGTEAEKQKKIYKTITKKITLKPNEVLYLGAITLERIKKGYIYGYIVENEKGIESANVRLVGIRTGARQNITTDKDGFFRFSGLMEDTYVIIARKNQYKCAHSTSKITDGEKAEIEISMKRNRNPITLHPENKQ